MKCITSPALDDIQIVSYIEGEADDGVVAHIKECLFCRERANRWTLLQNGLREQLYRVTCPTPVELGDYHLGLLPAPQVLVIAQHVRECPLCRREVADLKNFLDDLAPEISLLGAARVLIARLISGNIGDSAPTVAALRGEAKGPITLEADGIVVELRQGNELQFSTRVDDLGTFQSEGIMPGSKELRIISKDNFLTVVSNFEVST